MQKKRIKKESEEMDEKNKKRNEFLKSEEITKNVGKSQKPINTTPSLHSSATHLPCFWLPSLAPEAQEEAQKPISEIVTCPFTGKILKLSKMIDVKFSSLTGASDSLICAASGTILTTSTPCVVLATTGDVVTLQYVNKIIKKPGETYMKCPFTGQTLEDRDIIQLKCGGSWHASGGDTHTAKVVTPAMLIS
ncbi:hypothetical protein HZS_4166 [Henneguya salminicola]|uniref:Nitric oxide synthase-interacting protein (Trinotate prediction) n=1 Tax=Henneguya salminicola TaxID=69463 RepID=A0A6G3MHR3_HENSL|nr:hypothetical protein HZS_4166 [Henneguya salminicola]